MGGRVVSAQDGRKGTHVIYFVTDQFPSNFSSIEKLDTNTHGRLAA
jgi:hypothetical protein